VGYLAIIDRYPSDWKRSHCLKQTLMQYSEMSYKTKKHALLRVRVILVLVYSGCSYWKSTKQLGLELIQLYSPSTKYNWISSFTSYPNFIRTLRFAWPYVGMGKTSLRLFHYNILKYKCNTLLRTSWPPLSPRWLGDKRLLRKRNLLLPLCCLCVCFRLCHCSTAWIKKWVISASLRALIISASAINESS